VEPDIVVVPEDLPIPVRVDLPNLFRVLEYSSYLLTIVSIAIFSIFMYQKRKNLEIMIRSVIVYLWLINMLLYHTAIILSRIGFLAIEYSDIFFLKWGIILRFHILLGGIFMLLFAFLERKSNGR